MDSKMAMTDSACCQAVEKELMKAQSRVQSMKKLAGNSFDSAISDLESLQKELASRQTDELRSKPSTLQQTIIKEALKRSKDVGKNLSSQHKDMHSVISKYGKSIDKNFHSDYSVISRGVNDNSRTALLNEVICEHFLRQGRLNVAEHLIQESNLDLDESMKVPFLEMHAIVEGLKRKDLNGILRWVDSNDSALAAIESDLKFCVLRMHFLQILCSGTANSRRTALDYCRLHLQPFAYSHTADLQQLMGCFAFHGKSLALSPYAHLISADAWESLIEQFSKDACTLLGLPVESPLSITVNAGTKALAPLLHITSVVKQMNPVWDSMNELPVDIELGVGARYHSIFACPILRQHTSENNPPMRLTCGHVISRDAMQKLSHGQKLKCPYCPVEQTMSEAIRLHL